MRCNDGTKVDEDTLSTAFLMAHISSVEIRKKPKKQKEEEKTKIYQEAQTIDQKELFTHIGACLLFSIVVFYFLATLGNQFVNLENL